MSDTRRALLAGTGAALVTVLLLAAGVDPGKLALLGGLMGLLGIVVALRRLW